MSLLTTIYIVNVFYHNPRKEVPNWLKKYILNGVAKTTCYTANENQEQNTPGHEAMQTRKGRQDHWVAEKRIRNPKIRHVISTDRISRAAVFVPNNNATWNSIDARINIISYLCANTNQGNHKPMTVPKVTEGEVWRNREEWQKASRILDRLVLILTILSVVALTLFLFIAIRI